MIRRALLSVSDKTDLATLAQGLITLGIQLLSTGGTAANLRQQGIPVTDISEITHFPEMLDGRVKTLHPHVHAGILARRGIDDATLTQHSIGFIDLVVVNLYPFQQTITNNQCTLSDAIENIDIGGPTLLRAAAKNFQDVTVIVDPQDYLPLLTELRANQGATLLATRQQLAQKAFAHTAEYDIAIANYFTQAAALPHTWLASATQQQSLRYGENPHQAAAFYRLPHVSEGTITSATQLQGKELSYNNIADADAALECVKSFSDHPTCVIVKHGNPCGVASADNTLRAYQRAYLTDPTSSFGGIIAFNCIVDGATIAAILAQQFVEVIIAPDFSADARTILTNKPNVRALVTGHWPALPPFELTIKSVAGGVLVQHADQQPLSWTECRIVTETQPTLQQQQDLWFAWHVAKFVKSNAIVYAKDNATIGIGAGQMSRVVSAQIANLKAAEANLCVTDAVMASDAFFPFRDGIDAAVAAGIAAIIQPGGSLRDDEIIAAANAANIAMVFTGVRHFRH